MNAKFLKTSALILSLGFSFSPFAMADTPNAGCLISCQAGLDSCAVNCADKYTSDEDKNLCRSACAFGRQSCDVNCVANFGRS